MAPIKDSCKPLSPFKRRTTKNGKPIYTNLDCKKPISSSPFNTISSPNNFVATQALSRYLFIYFRSATITTLICFKKRLKTAERRKKDSMKLNSGSCCTVFSTPKSKWKQETHPESVTSDLKISSLTKKDSWKSQTFFLGPSKLPAIKNSSKINPLTSLHKTCHWLKPPTSITVKTSNPKSFPLASPF